MTHAEDRNKGESRRGPKARRLGGFVLPPLADLFPFEYTGGGYFRRRGVPKGESADIDYWTLDIAPK